MEIFQNQYYHLYNRSNNNEIIFKEPDNYSYFLNKYNNHLRGYLDTIAFCLMPTHFHFLVYVQTDNILDAKNKIGLWLSAYTKSINKRYIRHGSLFQQHTKTKLIDNEEYLLNIINYIHQNPIRAGLVKRLYEWEYSSFLDYISERKLTLIPLRKDIVEKHFPTTNEFIEFSNFLSTSIDQKYWV